MACGNDDDAALGDADLETAAVETLPMGDDVGVVSVATALGEAIAENEGVDSWRLPYEQQYAGQRRPSCPRTCRVGQLPFSPFAVTCRLDGHAFHMAARSNRRRQRHQRQHRS